MNPIEARQNKYLTNIVEQSHGKMKGKMYQCLGWQSDEGVRVLGYKLWSMIKHR